MKSTNMHPHRLLRTSQGELSIPGPPLPTPYSHWMLREIHEQPGTIRATLDRYVSAGQFREQECRPVRDWLASVEDKIVIAASGSSRHAAMVAEMLIEDASRIAVDVEYASEYTYRSAPPHSSGKLQSQGVLVVSQSGETADTLAALRRANNTGCKTLAITNVADSTMAHEASFSFPTAARRERAIPATKSFTAQLVNLYLLSLLAAESKGTMDHASIGSHLQRADELPHLIQAQLADWQQDVEALVQQYRGTKSLLFLGRGVHYPVAREGALKLKESSYLHAEGYPSGELKHGPNALVAEGIPLVMIATVDRNDAGSTARYELVLKLMSDMHMQGADILAIANEGDTAVTHFATNTLRVRETTESLLPLCEVIPLQLLAYFMATQNGIDVDNPRNLVKAVVQE